MNREQKFDYDGILSNDTQGKNHNPTPPKLST